MNQQPHLSLCMIVRDASSTIGALLDSVLKYAPRSTGVVAPSFDEYVLVDTGSVDDTREKIAVAFGPQDFEPLPDGTWREPKVEWPVAVGDEPRVVNLKHKASGQQVRLVLARFAWIGDFSAARNYSFSLATAKWRCWLDSDDVLDPVDLRRMLQAAEQRNASVNAIEMQYDYAPTMQQDKCRIMRWADGWVWTGMVHEHPIRTKGARVVSHWSVWVRHCPVDATHNFQSMARNIELCEISIVEARKRGDRTEVGISAYTLGTYARHMGEYKTAIGLLHEAIDALPYTNISALAAVALSQAHADHGDYGAATEAAALAVAHGPEFPESWGALAIATKERGELNRAMELFDRALTLPEPPIHTSRDLAYKGVVMAQAALTYAAMGRADDALAVRERVPEEIAHEPAVQPLLREANRQAMKYIGLEMLRNMTDYYLWDTEAEKALALLNQAPAAIADSVEVAKLRRSLLSKMKHLTDGWEGYKKAYADVPTHIMMGAPEAKGAVLNTGRAQHVIEWAKNLPKEGGPLWVLSIGSHDGLIERACLEACSRLHFYVCDVAPQTGPDLQKLMEDFSGRVRVHTVRLHHYDWPLWAEPPDSGVPPGSEASARLFDAIMMFEVIEHLPNEAVALNNLYHRLRDDGTLFLSTPVADHWVEPYLTGPMGPAFHGHVRANNPTSMWRALRGADFDGTLWATDNGMVFLAEMHRQAGPTRASIAIYAPWTPHPYDFDAHLRQHVGGSEEAVIHLSKALAGRGYEVTVYCPRPARPDGRIAHAHAGVLWRETGEFDFGSEEYAAVLFWRSPATLLDPEVQAAKYKRILWLHDSQYGCDPACYEAADAVIVLSDTHEQAITERDLGGDKSKVKFASGANGIDLDLHRELREEEERRDNKKCIYASAPERGLDHLLSVWPRVREAVPDVTLDVYYDWTLFTSAHPRWAEKLHKQIAALKDAGVTYHGGVDHKTLEAASRAAGIFAYPSGFLEIFCTSAVKFQAAGCWPVTTDVGAVKEVVIHGRMVGAPDWDSAWRVVHAADAAKRNGAFDQSDSPGIEAIESAPDIKKFEAEYLDLLIGTLRAPPTFAVRKAMSDAARARYSWEHAAGMFSRIIREVCRG